MVTETIHFYDSGGRDNDYANYEDYSIEFDGVENQIRLQFNSWQFQDGYDYMKIFFKNTPDASYVEQTNIEGFSGISSGSSLTLDTSNRFVKFEFYSNSWTTKDGEFDLYFWKENTFKIIL